MFRSLAIFACLFLSLVKLSGAAERPNIVVILADDLGFADLGCYGSTRNLTPHIDRMAREGMRFTDFHSNGPMCSPTRAALLTGMYQQRTDLEKVLDIGVAGLPHAAATIPERLKEAGYATAIFGKWHLGNLPGSNPVNHGFDEFKGHLTSATDYKSHIDREGNHDWWDNEEPHRNSSYNTSAITEDSVSFIERNRGRPFFLYVSHSAIHFPWMSPVDPAYRVEGKNYERGLAKLGPRGTEVDLSNVVKAMTESLDASTGRILEALSDHTLRGKTLVIFSSDNGGYLDYQGHHAGQISDNGPYRGQKGSVFEGGHRVSTIAWWPGRIQPQRVTDATALSMDLMPTFLRLAGLPLKEANPTLDLDGIDLAPLLFELAPPAERKFVFWRMGDQAAVRGGDWKLVRIRDQPPLLFNLKSDPGESKDLAARNPELVDDMVAALSAWESDVDSRKIR